MEREMHDRLLKKGAEVLMEEMKREMGELERLLSIGPRPGRQAAAPKNGGVPRRRHLSLAARRAASLRMKKMWREGKLGPRASK